MSEKMPRVWNKRDPKCPKDAVYVGRPSRWGNPARIGTGVTRDVAIDLYRAYLKTPQGQTLLEGIKELQGKDLVCWCSPLPCHADVLLELANKLEAKP